jgi:hypothetical protein
MRNYDPHLEHLGAAKKRRNRMTSFKIDEISLVDIPAQKGAVATFMKNHGRDLSKSNQEGEDMSAISEKLDGLQRQIRKLQTHIDETTENMVTKQDQEAALPVIAKAIRLETGCPPADAMTSARLFLSEPEAFGKRYGYLLGKVVDACKTQTRVSKGASFEKHVADILDATRDSKTKRITITRQEAMKRARQEYPEAFADYQNMK